MEPLPNEIWTHIVENHMGSPEWLALCLTSTFFKQIAQASLYKSVCLRTARRYDHPINRDMSLMQFSRTLEERAKLRGYVRILTIETVEPHGGSYAKNRLVFTTAMLPQLRTLRLRRFYIEDTFFSTLRSYYPRITSVELGNCFIASNSLDAHVHPNSNPHFLGLSTNCQDTLARTTRCVMSLPAGFQEAGSCRETQHCGDPQHGNRDLQNINARFGVNALTMLMINYHLCSPNNLILFLISTPGIRVLSLGVWEGNSYYMTELSSLPSHALPLLEDFSGPAEFSQIFVRGRPVHTVDLCVSLLSPADVLLCLQHSTASIVKLAVFAWRPSIEYGTLLQHAPLSVRELTLNVPYEKIAQSMIPSLSHLRYLQMVKVGVEPIGHIGEARAENAQMAQKLSDICPSIRAFNFVGERWLALRDGVWEQYMGADDSDDLWGSGSGR